MSLSKFSSTTKGENIVISNEGTTATWGSKKKRYIINENAMLDNTEMTLEVYGKLYTKIVVGFTIMNPNSRNSHRISPRGKMYVGVQKTNRSIKIKRCNNHVYLELNKAVKKKKRCTAKEIWIVVGLYYGDGHVTLSKNQSEPLKQWKDLGGNVEQFSSGCRLKDWNSESFACVPTSKGVGMVMKIRPINKDRDHFVTVNKFNTTTSYQNKTRGVLSVCDTILTLKNKTTNLKIEVQSNGEIFYFWGNRKNSTTAETECIRNNNFAIVFELFNTRLTIIESYIIDEIENGPVVQPDALVNSACVESETTSSLESIMNFEDDEDDENDNQITQVKFCLQSESDDVLSEKSKNELKTNEDLSMVKPPRKQICMAARHPQKHKDKYFITSNYTKLLDELEPYPFCDHLVQQGFMSMEDNNYITRIRDNKPRRDVIREILSILNKSKINEETFKLILEKSDSSHLL